MTGLRPSRPRRSRRAQSSTESEPAAVWQTRPNPVARCLVGPAVQVLPRDHRDRYREEFRTELCELVGPAQVAAAASLLRGCLSLRYALLDRQVAAQARPRRSMRCRLGRHQYTAQRDVDLSKEHHMSYRCLRCGAYFERKRDEAEGFDIEAHSRNSNYLGGGAF
jgi:hypothetical protein